MIDFYASEPHYCAHLAPIWLALDPSQRGTFRGTHRSLPEALAWGIDMTCEYWERGDVLVVAAHRDQRGARYRQIVLLNHGSGQRYADARNSNGYVGGRQREHFALLLEPNPQSAALAPAGVRTEVVGVPFLDRWHKMARCVCGHEQSEHHGDPGRGPCMFSAETETWACPCHEFAREGDDTGSGEVLGEVHDTRPVVAFTWHWDCTVSNESGTAFYDWRDRVAEITPGLRDAGIEVIGHSHPRIWDEARSFYAQHDIPTVERFADVLDRASLLVGDNTSALPEFASTGRPVLWINHSRWRRDVNHGGRFWDWPAGQVQCDDPQWLARSIGLAMADSPGVARARHAMVERIYPLRDGHAAERAAAAILSL